MGFFDSGLPTYAGYKIAFSSSHHPSHFFHPLNNLHMKWAPWLAISALDAIRGMAAQRCVVFFRQPVSILGEVVILEDVADIDADRTWQAMVAVDAAARRDGGGRAAEDVLVAAFLVRCMDVAEARLQFVHALDARDARDDGRPVEAVLDALRRRHGLAERAVAC